MAPSSRIAKSAVDHSGRFSLRIATRSPLRTPNFCNARTVPATLLRSWDDEIGRHSPSSRWSIARSRLRSMAAKKTSFRVERLMDRDFELNLNLLVYGALGQCERSRGKVLIQHPEPRMTIRLENYNVSA